MNPTTDATTAVTLTRPGDSTDPIGAAPAAHDAAAPATTTAAHAPQNVLVLGATSGIGRAVARRLARDGDSVLLAGRDVEEMNRDAADLRVRYGVPAAAVPFDATDFAGHPAFVRRCADHFAAAGGLDGVVLCHGFMADQRAAERDFDLALKTIHTNFASPVSLLEPVAAYLEQRGRGGFVCAVSSVAGDRGRQSNYIYGSTKAALTAYLQGLRNRLTPAGVAVVTVKPGFVDTGMTWGLLKPGSPLTAQPEKVADDIVTAIRRGTPEIYTPWFWRGIMGVIKNIPEPVFRRLKL